MSYVDYISYVGRLNEIYDLHMLYEYFVNHLESLINSLELF